MSFEIKRATRQGVIPLIGCYGESGTGKTMSALLLARGLAGPSGKMAMIDTESGRGSLYADVIPGGYDTLNLEPPFTPARYIEALQAVFNGGFGVVVVDSMSHEHEGMGGVLDMASDNEARTGKPGLHNWKTPKLEHAKMVHLLLRSPVPVICCIRAKYKTRQIKENGKTQIIKDDKTSPIQSEDFIYEMTAHFEVLPDHSIFLTKHSHPALKKCFPDKGPITEETGGLIAAWCASPGAPPSKPPTGKPTSQLAKLKKDLWEMSKAIHNGNPKALEQFLWDEAIISDTETLETLAESRFEEVIAKVDTHLEVTP